MAVPSGKQTIRQPRLALRVCLCAVAFCVLLLAARPAAAVDILRPPSGKVFFGVTDTGYFEDFQAFEGLVATHPTVIETFHPWGNNLHFAIPRWGYAAAQPMLHISTVNDQTLQEIITPRGIATGTSDDYLIRLNSSFGTRQLHVYIRPLGEMNRCLNAWASYDCLGNPRGDSYTPYWYKQAFRRIAIILRGGGTLAEINARLSAIGLPPLDRKAKDGVEPDFLPAAPVVMVWSPLPGGSPATKRNRPIHFWPGSSYVDWVGTDIYSRYPVWRTLNRFYKTKKFRRKPLSLTEWGVSAGDDPKFVKRLFAWVRHHKRTKMLIYYQDFGDSNPYRLQNYPRSRGVIVRNLRQRRYPTTAPYPVPPPPDGTPADPNDPPPPPTGGTGG